MVKPGPSYFDDPLLHLKDGSWTCAFIDSGMKKLFAFSKSNYLIKTVWLVAENTGKIKGFGIESQVTEPLKREERRHVLFSVESDIGMDLAERFGAIPVFDNSLHMLHGKTVRKIKALGVVKDSVIEYEGEPFTEILQSLAEENNVIEPWFYRPVFSVPEPRLGFDTLFIKLHPGIPPIRLDFLNLSLDEALTIYILYSWNNIIPGYPLPLKVVHDHHKIYDSEFYGAKYKVGYENPRFLDKDLWLSLYRGFY
jgi:hypothetical protein